jgi:DNA-binding MarR family transcriptional regulator
MNPRDRASDRSGADLPGPDVPGRFAYDGLERVIHEKARLGILTSLVTHPDGLLFNELKELCALTDGNLSRHLDMLEEAGYIDVWKRTAGRRPQTLVRLTEPGRQRFHDYLAVLEQIVSDAAEAARSAVVSRAGIQPGLST